jgi:hydrogenase-4 component F
VTDLVPILVLVVPGLPILVAAAVALTRTPAQADRVAVGGAVLAAVAALLLAGVALARGGDQPLRGTIHLVDGASGVFLAVIAIVGLCSALVSPSYLRTAGRGWFSAERSRHWYYVALFLFWSALLAVPIAGNLAVAWLLVEATTATSALLVAFTGRREALEAGWKYLVLTTLGLSVSLLGIIVLALTLATRGHLGLHALDWHALDTTAAGLPHRQALIALVLILAGLATKIGWVPVHNWLPDAHSEAPAPVSALLSAAVLPTVVLVAWRAKGTLDVAVGNGTARALFLGFGLASLIVAVPFLWRPLPWKRLLAYSSVEHMGIIALGIGFGSPLAIAGVVVHVAAHALAKALGFYAALPLLRIDPGAARRAPAAVQAASPPTARAMAVSLATLGGLPPSPVFVSELLILLGGFATNAAVAAIATVALALGFLGLLHVLVEGVVGEPAHKRPRRTRSERPLAAMTVVLGAALLALTAAAVLLPGSAFVSTLAQAAL